MGARGHQEAALDPGRVHFGDDIRQFVAGELLVLDADVVDEEVPHRAAALRDGLLRPEV